MKKTLSLFFLFFSFQIIFSQENHVNHTELDWFSIETPHFYIHYHNGAERSARVVAKIAEEIYGPITSLYEHEPDQKVSIIMKDYDDYSNGAAYFFDNKIELWAPALDFDLRGTHNWLRNVVTHEFTHIIQIQTSMKFGRRIPSIYIQWLGYEDERRPDVLYGFPNTIVTYPISGFTVPSWFAEGVAQYNRPELLYDYWDSHRDMILRMYALDGKMLTWSEMSVFGKTSLGNESSYNAGFALVKYISEKYGAEAIPKISKNLSHLTTLTIDQAIEKAIGKSGKELYKEWQEYITADYKKRAEPIVKNKIEGETIASVGFGNFYPTFSPDGKTIAYTSNKKADYFGLSSLYIYNVETKEEKKINDGIISTLSYSPDGKKIYYSKTENENPNWSNFSDIYVFNLETEKETRLTFGLRAHNPSLSADGKNLTFAFSNDGTMNIGIVDSVGKNFRSLTKFKNGEQCYTPKWSPDGKTIIFGYSQKDNQDIATISVENDSLEMLIVGDDDERNPIFSLDGKAIIFSSDKTGIFNLYKYDISTKNIEQITNVLGGAFMPTINTKGNIAFSSYTSNGFKINFLEKSTPQNFSETQYIHPKYTPLAVSLQTQQIRPQFDWTKLHFYDDTQYSTEKSTPYKNIFTTLTLVPFLRIDNYNKNNTGIDFLKPGLYFLSSDVLDKLNMFGGAAINRLLERDIFVSFEYRDRIIGLHQLGLSPTFSLQLFNITRKSTQKDITIGIDKYNFDVTYGLFEFDFFFKHHLFSTADILTLGFAHSRYSTDIGSFVLRGDDSHAPILVPSSSELYFKGNDISLQWEAKMLARSCDSEINPVGRTIDFSYDYEMNRFNSTGEYEATETGLNPKLTPYNFHKVELHYSEHFQLPLWKHTLSLSLRGGSILGGTVPDYFDFYAGGLIGMRGYPFYAIGGNEIATANLTYRFPLWENIDLRILHLYFDKLYASVHTDFGNAWTGKPNLQKFKKDIGFELRLESFSFYAYPTRIFFNGTYGLDSFTLNRNDITVRYGKEWRFYFGVLFGFEI